MTKIDQIAQAFAQGVKFAENLKLAMDAAKGKDDENGHWVTIGEGEEARPVFIKGKKKAAKTESKKKNDQIFRSMSRKEFADMFRSTGGDELSENSTLKIWYKDHTFKHFDYESDRKELAKALRQPGIKAIAWSNEGDVGYYGSPKDIVLRNVNTDETKPLSEVQKDAGIGSLWVVDDVIDNSGNKKTESKKSNLSSEDRQALRKLKTDNTKALKDLDNLKNSLSAENIARKKYHLSKADAEIVQDTRQKIDQLKPLSAKLIKQVTANVADGRYSIDAAQEILAAANRTIRQIRNIGSHMYAASMHGYGAPNAMEDDHKLIKGLYTKLYKANKEAENKAHEQNAAI